MKSFFVGAALILGAAQVLFAQEVNIQNSEDQVNQSNTTFFNEFLGFNADGFYVLRTGGSITNEEILIERYSKTFKFIKSIRVPNSEGVMGDGKLHRKTLMNNRKIYHFYDGWNKKEGKSSLHVYLSDEDGAPLKEARVLENISAPSQMNSAWFRYMFSPDGNKLLIATELPFEKGATEKFKIQVFSTEDLSALWSYTINYEFESKRNPSNLTAVNNQGVVVIFKEHDHGKKERTYQWISVTENGPEVEPLNLNGTYPIATQLVVGKNDEFFLSGMTTELGKNISTWQRVMHLCASKDGKMMSFTNPFIAEELMRKVASERAASTPGHALSDYVLLNTFTTSKQYTYMVIEQQTTTKNIIPNTQPVASEYIYNYGSVIVLALDDKGEQIWSAVLDKKQSEKTLDPNVKSGSVLSVMKNDQVYLLWNFFAFEREVGNAKRFWRDKSGAKIYVDDIFGRDAIYPVFMTAIDDKGAFVYDNRTFASMPLSNLLKMGSFAMAFDPNFYTQTEEGLVVLTLMEGRSAKRYKFSTISF
jgi:hypothetical protein